MIDRGGMEGVGERCSKLGRERGRTKEKEEGGREERKRETGVGVGV